MTPTIHRDELARIADALTAAGEAWASRAATIAELGVVTPGTAEVRDQIEVLPAVHMGSPDLYTYPAVLYRNEQGEWWPTGFSGASRGQVRRPSGVTYDPDAGVDVSEQGADHV